jgi:hypothetical protein
MLDLIIAAALLQTNACNAVDRPGPAGCPDWQMLHDGPEVQVLAEPASVRRNGNVFELRFRLIFAADQRNGTRSGIVTYRFDCAGETGTLLQSRYYTAAGAPLADGPRPSGRALASPPGSPNRAALDRFCLPARTAR